MNQPSQRQPSTERKHKNDHSKKDAIKPCVLISPSIDDRRLNVASRDITTTVFTTRITTRDGNKRWAFLVVVHLHGTFLRGALKIGVTFSWSNRWYRQNIFQPCGLAPFNEAPSLLVIKSNPIKPQVTRNVCRICPTKQRLGER